eukprot:jgi/Ulvmu1/3653/UM017_0067.1
MSTPQSRTKRRRGASEASVPAREPGKRALYHCNYCQRNITDHVRIKCAQCMDFDLCVECFSVGVELGDHKNSHSYRVMDFLAFPLYDPAWGADEELLLLEAIDMYGIGNWTAVAEHVGEKPAEACKLHYYHTYVESPDAPLPTPAPELANIDISDLVKRRLSYNNGATTATPVATPPPGSGNIDEAPTKMPAIDAGDAPAMTPPGNGGASGKHASKTTPAPARRRGRGARASTIAATAATDSAVAQAPEGSTVAAAAAAAAGPSGGRNTAKVETSGYLRYRDEFDPEFDGEAELPIAQLEFLESDPPELISAKVRMLQIYNERLTERETRRESIKKLGLTDVRKLQAAEKRRAPFERRLHAALRVFERYQTPEAAEALCSGMLLEAQLRSRIDALKALRRLGARTFTSGELIQADLKRQEQVAAGRPAGRPDRQNRMPAEEAGGPGSAAVLPHIPTPAGASARPPAVQAWKGRRNAPLDVSQLPGAGVLTARERELCSTQRFVPGHWMLLKETLMREDARAGGTLGRAAARNLFRLEQGRATKLWDVAHEMNWIGEAALAGSKAVAAAAAAGGGVAAGGGQDGAGEGAGEGAPEGEG